MSKHEKLPFTPTPKEREDMERYLQAIEDTTKKEFVELQEERDILEHTQDYELDQNFPQASKNIPNFINQNDIHLERATGDLIAAEDDIAFVQKQTEQEARRIQELNTKAHQLFLKNQPLPETLQQQLEVLRKQAETELNEAKQAETALADTAHPSLRTQAQLRTQLAQENYDALLEDLGRQTNSQ